ncbi:HpcH/HpaI aldolase/citrate lyase family protein [Limobrevibacterium gyesilva]|uniref:CoA ester lyase n=1 Tax=Limobrevibacterium gyesilva TaxID=2991712 RepID=A0AA41YPR1_9PROT|nr:CoA ester lyase [Limobrevibacterium gyesilva]MCW3477801.1 CoA ester lyase [Limobrevibacterium gyesilva]
MNHAPSPAPVWRSLLYVPAHVGRFVDKAHTRGADCIQLDLEDSVPPSEKVTARAGVAAAAAKVRRGAADVLVRINAPLALAVPDIQAAIGPDVDGLTVTKARGPDHVRLLDELVSECEAKAGLPVGRTWFYLLVETPEALPQAAAIASASPRTVAMSLGAEDFATAIGAEPTEEALLVARQMLLIAARAAGVMPLGLVGSIAGFADPAAFQAMAERSRRMGYEGASCINPAQVAPLNAAFTPSEADVAYAGRVIAADAEARAHGRGAVALDGRMIDVPIVRRAERLLARHAAVARRMAVQG